LAGERVVVMEGMLQTFLWLLAFLPLCVSDEPTAADADAQFMAWIHAGGVDTSGIDVVETKGSGRGVVTKRNISVGEAIFTVPMELVLTSSVARTGLFELVESKVDSNELGVLFKKFNVSACETVLLYLVTERLTRNQPALWQNRTMGWWKPYTAMLPLAPQIPLFHQEQIMGILQVDTAL
jgi:hypothetical protein